MPTNLLHIKSTNNPVRIEGVSTGSSSDSIITLNDSGVIRKMTANNFASANEPWFNISTNKGATSNTQDIYQMGKVGINTSSLLNQLTVKGANNQPTANGQTQTNAIFRIDGSSNHALDMGTLNNVPYGSYVQSHNKASTTSLPLSLNPMGGNVGVNILSPNAPLDVLSTYSEVARLTTSATGGTYGGVALGNNTGVWTKLAGGEGKFQIRNFSNDTIVFHADLVTKNIGLGTTNPTHKLEINSGTAGASGLKIAQLSANINSTSTANTALLGIDNNGVIVPVGSSKRVENISTNAVTTVPINTFGSYKVTIAGSEDAANGYKTFADEYLVTYANNFNKLSVVQVSGVYSNLGAQTMKSGYNINSVTLTPDHGSYDILFSVAGTSGTIDAKALRGLAILSIKTISLW